MTLRGIWDPQMGSTFCNVATNPGWLVVASLKNLTHKKLEDEVIGEGAVVPQ